MRAGLSESLVVNDGVQREKNQKVFALVFGDNIAPTIRFQLPEIEHYHLLKSIDYGPINIEPTAPQYRDATIEITIWTMGLQKVFSFAYSPCLRDLVRRHDRLETACY